MNEEFSGEVELSLLNFKNAKPIKKWNQKIHLNPFESKQVIIIPKEHFQSFKEKAYLKLELKNKDEIISSKNIFFLPFKNLSLSNPEIDYKWKLDKIERKINITVKSKYFAKGILSLQLVNLTLMITFLTLSFRTKTVTIKIKKDENINEIVNSINILDVWNAHN